jgi:hypothetical protein
MPNKISLTPENVKYLIDAFAHFFPEDTIYSADKQYISGEFNWKNRQDFIDFVYRLTGILIKSDKDFENIKKAELAVEELASEKQVEANMPEKELREQQEAERLLREKQLKESQKVAQESVRKAVRKKEEVYKKAEEVKKATAHEEKAQKVERTIVGSPKPATSEPQGTTEKQKVEQQKQVAWKRPQEQKPPQVPTKLEQQGVLTELSGKVVYATPVVKRPETTLSKSEGALVNIAKVDPQLFITKLSTLIVQNNPGIPAETLEPLSKIIAVDAAQALASYTNKPIPTGVLASLGNISKVMPGLNPTTINELAKTTSLFTPLSEGQENLYRVVLTGSLGENLTNKILGFPQEEYTLSTSETEGAFAIKLDQLQNNSFSYQESSDFQILNNPVFGEAKSAAERRLQEFAVSKLKTLAPESLMGKVSRFANSQAFDSIAPFVGVQTNFDYVGTDFFGKAVTKLLPDYAPLISNVAGRLGIDIGIQAVTPIAISTAETGEAIVTGAAAKKVAGGIFGKAIGAVATKLGLSTAITAAGQVLGSLAPVVGNAIAFVATSLLGKIIEKINWKKVKEYLAPIIGGTATLIATPFIGVGAAIGVGVGVTFVSAALGAGVGGVTAGAVGGAVAGTIGNIASALSIAIGLPILISILVLPVIVALILFIINTGAYLVPPTASVFGNVSSPYIGITKEAEPPGPFQNSALPKTITYKVTITAKKGSLTNVVINYDCQVISKSQKQCPSVSGLPDTKDNISPSAPYTFEYTSTYDQNYTDSAIIDTISISADATEQKGATADTSATVTFGNPPISCPLPAGKPLNSMNYSYDAQTNTGHGSTQYWTMMGSPYYRYPLPQLTACYHPADCPFYGYSYDVFPSGTITVFAPTILGQETTWNLAATFDNPSAGHSLVYTDSSGSYTIVLTHIASTSAPQTAASGTQVATLFDQGGNTHLHIEFQVNGRWAKPENYFCK